MRAGLTAWPLPAVLTWVAAWVLFKLLIEQGTATDVALGAATALGVACSLWGNSWWRRLLIAGGFPLSLALTFPHVLVARTFSKAYSLCFQRVGYFVGHVDLIAALDKIRDSYNVNGLGQIAALATLDDLSCYRANFRKIIATREKLSLELGELGFEVFPSQTNFILTRPPKFAAQAWLQKLRDRKILVRWFSQASVRDYLRITIGTPAEAEALVRAARAILRAKQP